MSWAIVAALIVVCVLVWASIGFFAKAPEPKPVPPAPVRHKAPPKPNSIFDQ